MGGMIREPRERRVVWPTSMLDDEIVVRQRQVIRGLLEGTEGGSLSETV